MNLVERMLNPKGGWQPAEDHLLVYDKIKPLESYILGKKVLDCGCAGDCELGLMHSTLREKAAYCIGVEVDEAKAKAMREKGFNVIQGDAQSISLNETFDVVFAGELLEHLSNIGMFLQNAARHLNDKSILVITTPNFYFSTMLLRLFFKKDISVNKEHVCWFDVKTLQNLLERHGFQVERVIYYQNSPRLLVNLVARLNHRLARSIIVIARKK